MLVTKRDYACAAVLAAAKETSSIAVTPKLQENINALVAKEDYAGVAVLAAAMEKSNYVVSASDARAVAARVARNKNIKSLREREILGAINALMMKNDYAGAAVLAAAMKKSSDVVSASNARAVAPKETEEKKPLRRRRFQEKISELVTNEHKTMLLQYPGL